MKYGHEINEFITHLCRNNFTLRNTSIFHVALNKQHMLKLFSSHYFVGKLVLIKNVLLFGTSTFRIVIDIHINYVCKTDHNSVTIFFTP